MSELAMKTLEEKRLENMKLNHKLSLVEVSVRELKNLVYGGEMVADEWTMEYLQKIVKSFEDIEPATQKYYETVKEKLEFLNS